MRKDLRMLMETARAVQCELLPTEQSFDEALGGMGKLIHTICSKRVEAGLPMHTAQDALRHLTAATMKIGEARADIVLAHASLAQQASSLLPETGWGDGSACPPAQAVLSASAGLRSVA